MEVDAGPPDRFHLLYEQVCINIRTTDEISFKLLGFVPLVSGAGIAILLSNETLKDLPVALFAGLVGAVVTVGLLMWELRNIDTCKYLIKTGRLLEQYAKFAHGQFEAREADKVLFLRQGKTEAVKVIYTATVVAWLFLPVVAAWPEIDKAIPWPR